MPVTPLHWGPSLLAGLLARKYIDIPTLMAASVAPDIRTTMVFFGLVQGELHGPLHTFAGSTVLALAIAAAVIPFRPRFEEAMELLQIPQDYSTQSILAASFIGVYSHVALDAFLYTDMQPFYPLDINPLLNVLTVQQVFGFCILTLFLGFIAYVGLLTRRELNS